MPLISVIVPVYNVEKYIHRCIDSILAQTFSSFELILVDDGSSDKCPQICDQYAEQDARIHVIHQKNAGLSAARNAGIDWVISNSNSQWLTFVDSDDSIHLQMLEVFYQVAEQSREKMIVANYHKIGESEIATSESVVTSYRLYTAHEAIDNLIFNDPGRWVTAWGKLYFIDLFKEIRFPIGRIYEDTYIMHHLMAEAKEIAEINIPLYFYRIRENSIMNRYGLKNYRDLYTAYLERTQFLKQNKYEDLYIRQRDLLEWQMKKEYDCQYGKKNTEAASEIFGCYKKFLFQNWASFTWKYRIRGMINCIKGKW